MSCLHPHQERTAPTTTLMYFARSPEYKHKSLISERPRLLVPRLECPPKYIRLHSIKTVLLSADTGLFPFGSFF